MILLCFILIGILLIFLISIGVVLSYLFFILLTIALIVGIINACFASSTYVLTNQTNYYSKGNVINQYRIAKKSRNYLDAYITANICALTFLYEGDEKNYIKWKKIEEEEKENLRYKNLI
ncbi:MAG: hypothetical protein WC942_11480 [Clostridia bacterium]|jgi:hypothetical protein